ncbi:alpha/beta fold hydrolase [Rhizobium sp.]|uniref:alpha/beta fold hydrolase n=1 Tax=Rhizobium sp. TaxID=391 RepID=UPI0028984438
MKCVLSTFILVAGAWHGRWCWEKLTPLLEKKSHRVITPELAGMNGDQAELPLDPLSNWADQIAEISREQADPVVLVGHSRAGLVISEVAERVPDKLGVLVYLSAYLLKNGQTLYEVAQRAENAAGFAAAVEFRDDGTARFKQEYLAELLYNDASDEDREIASQSLVLEPTASFTTPVRLTNDKFGRIPKAFVECAWDNAIPPALQQAMQEASRVDIRYRLESGHSPFFSAPMDLMDALEGIATQLNL